MLNHINTIPRKDQFLELLRDIKSLSVSPSERLKILYPFFQAILNMRTEDSPVHLTSQFARLSYLLSSIARIHNKDSYLLHYYRIYGGAVAEPEKIDPLLQLGQYVCQFLIDFSPDSQASSAAEREHLYHLFGRDAELKTQPVQFFSQKKLLILSIDVELKRIQALDEKDTATPYTISYRNPELQSDYTELFDQLARLDTLPLNCNFLEMSRHPEGLWQAQGYVLDPDFLFDVTSISECFGAFHTQEVGYILRRFLPKTFSTSILLGNIINYFLDRLIYDPAIRMEDLLAKIFMIDPLGFSMMSDKELREMIEQAQIHFTNIQNTVIGPLRKEGIKPEHCYVEPSFFSSSYGIQGRLDLFHLYEGHASIVELKSSKSYRPNSYGLNNNHYHQTLLYDLLIESVYGSSLKRRNYILYSRYSENGLRFAPAWKLQQREALKQRNCLYLLDKKLVQSDDPVSFVKNYFQEREAEIKGFLKTDADKLLRLFSDLTELERDYCNALFKFTMREFVLSKTGDEASDRSQGLSSIWNQSIAEKIEQFNIINHLVLRELIQEEEESLLCFKYSEFSAVLHNFREGDIAVLYPETGEAFSSVKNQVFKCTLLELGTDFVCLRLRSKQINEEVFQQFLYWNVEHDVLENGYHELSRSIYSFISSDPAYRRRILGLDPAGESSEYVDTNDDIGTASQRQAINRIVSAKDYYLLWGPPGTGKTSIIIRGLARYYQNQTSMRVLFLAFTNRAVDEMCHALSSTEPEVPFIRIGSRYSCDKNFIRNLLDEKIRDIGNRKELRQLLHTHRCYVATTASILGKQTIFELIDFDLIIVDEASQIIENALVGILSKAKKFVLIGDHQQLPAVVLQRKADSRTKSTLLREVGIRDLSISLFERMFKNCLTRGWGHSFGQLYEQGRLQSELLKFSNIQFYNNKLSCLEGFSRLTANRFFLKTRNSLTENIAANRILYIPTKRDLRLAGFKINNYEAEIVLKIIKALKELYQLNLMNWSADSVGVISPYRAQIAAIRDKLSQPEPIQYKQISVDTVERYQGGSRDIIVLSCCTNVETQMSSLQSLSEDGLDRKLNVAFTRAREHFILVGNEEILTGSDQYARLIELAYRLEI